MKLIWISVALLFIALSALTTKLSLASFRAHHIETRLVVWDQTGYLKDEREWQQLYDLNETTETLFVINPRHHRMRTRLLEWRSYLQRLHPAYAKKSEIEALAAFKDLAKLAPSMGYAWAGIAEIRAGQGMFDEETMSALYNAVLLDPVEDPTQRRIIRTGMEHWSKLNDESKVLVRRTVENALRVDVTLQPYPITDFVYDSTMDFGWEQELQSFLTTDARRKAFRDRKRYRDERPRLD